MVELTQEFTKASPEIVTVSLDDYGVISVSGDDAKMFLQGQLTCDVEQLSEQGWVYGAHCDNKGKTLSAFWLTRWQQQWLLIQPRSSLAESLAQLKKFGVFSRVEISDATDRWHFSGAFGSTVCQLLADRTGLAISDKPGAQAANDQHLVLTIGDSPCQLLLLSEAALPHEYPAIYWHALENERVRARLDPISVGEYVPQMLNLQALQAISFTKGCYIGQETVARMKYLGKQKRALFRATGKAHNVSNGDTLERAVADNWRRAGVVINAVNRADDQVDVLLVLPSDSEVGNNLRVQGQDESLLEIHPLPYQLD
ncbi:YgfZ/GcvT domain-containing protein [Idiomarina xiamenensis]|uniref:Glycine cleavage system protein T n=1 Tax=Idiomarina xiamenensis 10-D-4 TaxID=740709 RepID=K2KQT7_9GAMM|nr:glycine cleavage system protein T [Idiomarina xiamenensis]EKE84814.1 glycine cleavage system protein T [Idiomarina xiamenensis 10-D-4]